MSVVELSRRWWLAIGAGCALVVVLLVFFGRDGTPTDVAAPAASPALEELADGGARVPPLTDVVAQRSVPQHGADEVELCGVGWVRTGPGGGVDEADLQRVAHVAEARADLLATLRAQSGDHARAVVLWLELVGNESTRRVMTLSQVSCDAPECRPDAEAALRFSQGRDALAQLASTTRDPRVYALALNTCGPVRAGEGACQLLSAAQWARLEPDSATPWLFALQQAHERRDVAGQQEALYRISVAKRSSQHFFEPLDAVLGALPDTDAAMPAAMTLAMETMPVQAAWALPGYQGLGAMCQGAALRDTNRRQVCATVAELLVEHGDTLLERSFGSSIGQRLGWPQARLLRLRGEYLAYLDTMGGAMEPRTAGCEAMRRELDRVKLQARIGEAGAMRDWVVQSGKAPADFIRRAVREADARVAAAAASGASAPG